MKYVNGREVLPPKLLEQLQYYVQGELIYIPRPESKRAGWGAVNGTRLMIQMRNIEIQQQYDDGTTVIELANKYHLSEDSIRKVLVRKPVLK